MKRILFPLFLLLLFLCGCAKETEPVQTTIFSMNTVMDFKVWGKDSQSSVQDMTSLLQDLESRWSTTAADSLLSQLNGGADVSLSQDDAALLSQVEALSQRTGGAFDPKMRCVSEVWGFYNEEHHLPTQAQIDAALSNPQWDLGGALKGYAGQECVRLLSERNIDRALLNLGGNVQTYGEKSDGSPWQVAIQNPRFADDYLGIVSVTGTISVVTSGDYQRYFEQDGIRYHHILDPKTGAPARSGLSSVTVLCRDGLTADCLSTALFVMGLESGCDFWRQSSDFEAVFVTDDGRIYATEGVSLSGCQFEVISR